MKLKNIELYVYKLPLKNPLNLKGESVAVRYGMIVKIENDSGIVTHGEIAPLPHFSKETVIDSIAQIRTIKNDLLSINFTAEMWESQLLNTFAKWGLNPHPSALFGLESAFFKLFDTETNRRPIPMCGFLDGDMNTILSRAEQMGKGGYQSLKVKISQFPIDRAIHLVTNLQKILDGKTKLRLDTNQAWTLDEALEFGKKFYPNTFEYFEEPCKSFEESVAFGEKSGHPIAADESLRDRPLTETLNTACVKAIVLKPTMYGGAQFCMGVAKMAKNRGIDATFSSSYESTLGLSDIARLYLRSGSVAPVGIGTYNIFSQEPFLPQLSVQGGIVSLNPKEEISLSELKPMKI